MNNKMTEQELLERGEEYSKKLQTGMEEQGIHEKKFYALHENSAPPAEERLCPGPKNKAALTEFIKGGNILSDEEINRLQQAHS